ncbi:MAG: hypothetical protein HKN07_02290 [Acidimicrobiia bacterium]|nr:hypothetical protein [Acidimicrobiia bacterium]
MAAGIVLAIVLVGCGGAIDETTSPTVETGEQADTTQATVPEPSPTLVTESTEASTTTSTVVTLREPLDVAMEWIIAFEAGDVETFQRLMHPDATANCLNCGYDRQETSYFVQFGEGTADVADSRLLALGNGSLNAECNALGAVVTCETRRSTDFGHFNADGEPTLQWNATYELTVENGLITRRILTDNEGSAVDSAKLADYERWLMTNHPEIHGELFAFGTILLSTDEQFTNHRQYVPRYWASR